MPNAGESIIYLFGLCWRLLKRLDRRIIGLDYRWGVAYTWSDWTNADLWRSKKLQIPPRHFIADPFVISKCGRDFCFVEDFDYLKGRASVAVYELTSGRSTRIGTALEEAFHLSFPYLFEYQGELFMCPETSENKDIRIYKCIGFPLRWKLEKVIMTHISAADSMLFEKNGRWWMFTNIDPIGSGDHCSELFIFFSDSPFGNWIPHPLNPVFVDASRARNGGLVDDGTSLYRISQSQGFNRYGKGSRINKIVELTESSYVETTISQITPSFPKRLHGTHHLHSNRRITAFDFLTISNMRV